ncbi:MAG: WbqC family protein [Mariniphaga sp.]|nr:WbqC family protein [Mariniphaga sp.]
MNNQNTEVLLSTAYLAPIQYFTKLISYPQIYIEYCESYLKQSYRNRTIILAANGPLQLSIPVADGPRAKGPIKDLKLSYDQPWQLMHWRGISSTYNSSPFFEFYADDLAPFFHEKKWRYLFDFNLQLQDAILNSINFNVTINQTLDYYPQGKVPETMDDFRYDIHPKPQKQEADPHFFPTPYTQVFNEKWGFVPNLSILDLLFSEGPETIRHLRSCIR